MTIQLIASFAIAFLISVLFGAWLVPFLRKIKAGQSIKEIGPTWHQSKAGTPTMGGIMFILAAVIVCLTVGWKPMTEGDYGHIFVLIFALIYGAIGFLDDFDALISRRGCEKGSFSGCGDSRTYDLPTYQQAGRCGDSACSFSCHPFR